MKKIFLLLALLFFSPAEAQISYGGGGGGGAGNTGGSYDQLDVYLNTATNTTTAGFQKVPLDTVNYDTNSIWDATNKRVVPKRAGRYLVSIRARTNTANSLATFVAVNGSVTKGVGPDPGSTLAAGGEVWVQMNGTTDYIEAYVFTSNARAYTTGDFDTYMQVTGPFN
jgi:hypothetical protein